MSLGLKPSISIGQDLHRAATNRASEAGYLSFSSYIVGLIRADMIHRVDHSHSLKIVKLSGKARDEIDAAMLEASETRRPKSLDQQESESIIELMKNNRSPGTILRAVG